MTDLAINHSFAGGGWETRLSGAGTATVASDVAHCTGTGDGTGLFDYYVPVLPGMTVEAEVYGLLISGSALVALDAVFYNSSSWTTPDIVHLDAMDWKRYHVSATVPVAADQPTFLRLAIGIGSADAGEAKFTAPVIRVRNGYAPPLVLAAGLLRVQSGTPDLHPTFPSHGIASVSRTDTNTLTVTLDHEMPTSPGEVRARVYVSGTPDHAAIPLAGTFIAGASPTFVVKWSDGAAFADISTGNWFAFFRVEV